MDGTASATPTAAPTVVDAAAAPLRGTPSNYPAPFAARVARREKRPLGDLFGLKAFGVNLTRILPGGMSALMHRHSRQDEFVYILQGTPLLRTDVGEARLRPGLCAGFPAGGVAHHLVNDTDADVLYLEVGDRAPGDAGSYPEDDLMAVLDENGRWCFFHKDGTPY